MVLQPRPQLLRVTVLVGIVISCLAYLVLSFDSRARFSNPVTENFPRLPEDYHCYHDMIYGLSEPADILFVGASQTMFAIAPKIVENAYRDVRGDDKSVFSFVTAWSNPELAYAFFRDYLAHNPAPEVAMFQLATQLGGGNRPLPFAHPLFAYLAPPYLYWRELQSWPFVNSKLFAVSDFLRLIVRHIELTLNNLLTANRTFWVPARDNCEAAKQAEGFSTLRSEHDRFEPASTFEELMATEAGRILPAGGWEKVDDTETLTELYAKDKRIIRRIKKLGPSWAEGKPPNLWYYGRTKERDAYYYNRIAQLGQQHGVAVKFLVFPHILSSEPTAEQFEFYQSKAGAPVYALPYDYTKLTYHHYRDPIHVTGNATRLYSVWAASLIDTQEPD